MSTSIFKTLKKLGLTSEQSRVQFNNRTRDVDDLKVWRDKISGVIYIDDFYTGDNTYVRGNYRNDISIEKNNKKINYEKNLDAQRRFRSNLKFVEGKKILDFGCGSGEFLKLIQPYCNKVIGIELQQNYIEDLKNYGIECFNNLKGIKDNTLDLIVSFHVIEHLPNPLETLLELKGKIIHDGKILVEVPHANDFLLSAAECENFKQFTLWSQHLILHTRESLYKMLKFVGLKNIQIEGVQRYPLSNHLNWILKGKPGGHKSSLSTLESEELFNAYKNSLSRINATDTLVAIASV